VQLGICSLLVPTTDNGRPTTDDPRVVGGRWSVVNRQPEMNFRKAVLVETDENDDGNTHHAGDANPFYRWPPEGDPEGEPSVFLHPLTPCECNSMSTRFSHRLGRIC
jgi:hypothetical protein